MNSLLARLRREFVDVLGLEPESFVISGEFESRCNSFAQYAENHDILDLEDRLPGFFARMNSKFKMNADNLAALFKRGARAGRTFNYHQKQAIQSAFDRGELDRLPVLLRDFGVEDDLVEDLVTSASCVSRAESVCLLRAELDAPSGLRREVGNRDVTRQILQSLFAAFLWESLPEELMHAYFDEEYDAALYHSSFWEQLQSRSPRLFHRDQAMHFLNVTTAWASQFAELDDLRDALLQRIRLSYAELNNYGFLAVLIPAIDWRGREVSWELAADVALFGEKHIEHSIDRGYFRYAEIERETLAHTPGLDLDKARFDLGNEGFTYRDCFILGDSGSASVQQLLIFQKNHRDETRIPCPTCRSAEVEGNSYPSLGVKSWECRNPLCPDRSKYNRGKRFSFRALTMQQAIDDDRNEISPRSVTRWRRDVVEDASLDEVIDMLIRHYSMCGDDVWVFGVAAGVADAKGRHLHYSSLPTSGDGRDVGWFDAAAWFARYGVTQEASDAEAPTVLGTDEMRVLCGDSRTALQSVSDASVDGAVTSPPYYNARDYSQWPNLYCYLQDMGDVAREVFRVLRPGGDFYYNIFDYFDNERTVVFSAMGDKRLILSAYTIDLFRRIGFECVGNIVWDKGEIEGKRGFNAGNFSPFYQSPFNCWEHVLVFRKPCEPPARPAPTSHILREKPVIKIVGGRNTHGHPAPFPEAIPELCIQSLSPGDLVLDPFAGSLTTARAARRYRVRSLCVEQHMDYCRLGLDWDKSRSGPLLAARSWRCSKEVVLNERRSGHIGPRASRG